MARIPAGYSNLRKSFKKHSQEMKKCDDGPSSYLLYFYAIECGLKYLLVRYSSCQRTDEFDKDHPIHTHNLGKIIKKLKVSRSIVSEDPQHFRLRSDKDKNYGIHECHQAWRYGISIKTQDEESIIKYFDKIAEWIRRKII